MTSEVPALELDRGSMNHTICSLRLGSHYVRHGHSGGSGVYPFTISGLYLCLNSDLKLN